MDIENLKKDKDGLNKRKLTLTSLLKWLEVEFFGLFTFLFFFAFSSSNSIVVNIILGIIGILMVLCIMADFGLKAGQTCRNKVKLHGAEPCRNFGFALGAVSMTPSYLLLGILVLSRTGVIGNFLPAYKLLNACFFPIIDIAAPTVSINDASSALYIMMLFLPFLYLLSTAFAFKWGYDNVDIKTKVMYKNK